jgi:RNA polymerase sigma-54 factor
MIIDSLDDDGYFKVSFEELAALVPDDFDVQAEDFGAALKLVQSLDPAGVGARTLEECLCLQLEALPEDTPSRDVAMAIINTLRSIDPKSYSGMKNETTSSQP